MQLPLRLVGSTGRALYLETTRNGGLLLVLQIDGRPSLLRRDGSPLPVPDLTVPPDDVRLFPDGGRLAALHLRSAAPRLVLHDTDTGRALHTVPLDDLVPEGYAENTPPAWNEHYEHVLPERGRAAGHLFGAYCANIIWAWDSVKSLEMRIDDPVGPLPSQISLHPDGSRIVASTPSALVLVDTHTGTLVAQLPIEGVNWDSLCSDGESVLTVWFDDFGRLCTIEAGVSGNPYYELRSYTADGSPLSVHDRSLEWWSDAAGSEWTEFSGFEPFTCPPATHRPPGRALGRFSNGRAEVWTAEGLLRAVVRPKDALWLPGFGLQGAHERLPLLQLSPSELAAIELVSGKTTARTPPPWPGVFSKLRWCQWSPAGHHAVAIQEDGALWLWAIGEERWMRTELPERRRMCAWCLSDDDRVLYLADRDGSIWTADVPPAKPQRHPQGDPELEALRGALIATPDEATHLVYADALIERGDPRGELIVLHSRQQRGEDVAAAIDALLRAHDPVLAAGLHNTRDVTLSWKLGFVRALTVNTEYDRSVHQALALVSHEAGLLLESIALQGADREQVIRWLACIRRPSRLGRLTIGGEEIALGSLP